LPPQFTVDPSEQIDPVRIIDRAIDGLGKDLGGVINIAMDRISRDGSGSVTDLSEFLKRCIRISAGDRRTKYVVADRRTGRTEALIQGVFTPLQDGSVNIMLQLVSTSEGREILGVSRFIFPAGVISKWNLSPYPRKGDTTVTPGEQQRKEEIIRPYEGRDNPFAFTAILDHEDGIYYERERMTFTVNSERDCYIRISYVDVYGDVEVLFPQKARDTENNNNMVRAGVPWKLPDYIRFNLKPPFGEEYILIDAFEAPFIPKVEAVASLDASFLNKDYGTRAIEREDDAETAPGMVPPAMDPIAATMFSYTIFPRQPAP
jgi:hypothetical protein